VSAPSYLPQRSCFHLPHPPASITFGHEILQSLLIIFVSFVIYSCTSRSHLQGFLCPFTGLPHIAGAGIEICGFSETAALSASLYFIMIGVQGPNILSSQFHIFYSFFTEQLRILEHSTQSLSVIAEGAQHRQSAVHGQVLVDTEQALAPLRASSAKGSGGIARWTITSEAISLLLFLTFSVINANFDVRSQDFLASCDILDCVHCFSPNGLVPAVMDVGQA